MISWGLSISAAFYPVSGFPLSASNPATCHPGPPPATCIGDFASDVFPAANR